MKSKTITLPIIREGHTFNVTIFTNDFATGFAVDEIPGVCEENEDIPLDANERADARMLAMDGPKTQQPIGDFVPQSPAQREQDDRAADAYAGSFWTQNDRRAR